MIRPDLVLYGGNVVTLDPALHTTEAVAIAGDRIAEVGASRDIRRLAGADTRLVDLAGRTVVPGLVDAHAHMDREGLKLLCPSLGGARSIDDVLQRVEALVKAAAPGDWIVTMPLGDPPTTSTSPATSARSGSRLDAISTGWRREIPSISARSGATGATPCRSSPSPTATRCALRASRGRPCRR